VTDTVAGFLRAAEIEDIEGQTFNLGFGAEVTIRELVEQIFRILDRPIQADTTGPLTTRPLGFKEHPIEIDPQRLRPEKSEVQRLLSDNRLAKQRLGWTPQISLEEGLLRTIRWIESHLDLYPATGYQV